MTRGRLYQIEAKMDMLDPDSDEYKALDAEANEIAAALNAVEDAYKAKEKKLKEEREAAQRELRLKIMSGDENVIDLYGIPEFGSDYTIGQGGGGLWIVHSHAAGDNQNNDHTFSTENEAISKYRKLIWDRLYSKYVRSGSVGHLSEI